ncbi:TIGR02680 family protein [Amycolatopsis sp. BJA-103]|uniref:TIGR02680 family protein n=1 Tax=Amycolatopsis sp. BJA-103 TaxID=1911175 RepID=UPI000C762676|nr:TIGR02680 family protein [Amycolatopsis sp. BJA-103]AUI61804.1 TIGR02680 family protein [Amycolatopsis sp. BJA-103]PNE20896.1 TIGR02680 family protein [Amycolatopsis sp. BJA-103]
MTVTRWIPSRAGILNIWRYYDEIFEFHDGRLLLRGPNGSGKSKALELLLPFLFDASLRANRLSTFGTSERSMHWNLMGEGASSATRVGYVWLEFRKGEDQWFTCGARLQASTHTSTVHADFFTTGQRVGDGLPLVNEAGQPLTKNALEEALGDHGTVHPGAAEYRTEIRAKLFPTLSEQRYDALITALLQLRMPKLSQRLDPSLLSNLLSRALPPLGQQEIADLAEGFERLDAQREKLGSLETEVDATRALAARQKTYAQRVLRAGAANLIAATAELDGLAAAARRSAEEYDEVAASKAAAEERAAKLEKDVEETEARVSGLTDSESYQKGQELDKLRQRAFAARDQAGTLRADADRLRAEADADEERARGARQVVKRQADLVRSQEAEVRAAATRANLAGVHDELVAGLDDSGKQGEPVRLRPLLQAAVRGKRDQVETVGRAMDKHERAVGRRHQAEAELDRARSDFSAAQEKLDLTTATRELALSDLRTRLAEWAIGCRELRFPDVEALVREAEAEVALLGRISTVAETVLEDIVRQEAATGAALATARIEHDELLVEAGVLESEDVLTPESPRTRTADRTEMSGAPLWRLVDFAGSVPADTHAGIEAALEGAGLLDAWVNSHGVVDGHDVLAETGTLPVAPRSLADVFVPEPDAGVAPAKIRRVLEVIAFDDTLPAGPAAIGADGSWRMGSLSGSWAKEAPAYIGSSARLRARERRIAGLRDEISGREKIIAELEGELAALRGRRELIKIERAARPGHEDLLAATGESTTAEADLTAADSAVRHRETTVSALEIEAKTALHELTGQASDGGLPTERAPLTALATALRTYSDQGENWLYEHGNLLAATQRAETFADQAARSEANAARREDEAVEAEAERTKLTAMLEAIEGSVGTGQREVLAEIDGLRTKLRGLADELRAANADAKDLAVSLGALGVRRTTDARAREDAAKKQDAAALRFRKLATGVFPADGGIEDLPKFQATLSASEGVRAALDTARLVAAAWPSVPHAPSNLGEALHRLSEAVHTCRNTLSTRAELDLETDEDVQIFTAVVDGLRVGAAELLKILYAEAEQSRHEITGRESDLFDKTLTGDTRRHLAARIRQANDLVDGMNARLERVRTASRVAVRLVWQVSPDLPPGTKTARDLLLKDPDQLTAEDRVSLHKFFRERVEQAKADDTATSWEQQLAQVFDYTSWHRFVVKVDRANGAGWQLLTKKLHGALSGGEKAIALHLPLFAAVAAHYQAAPEAPRVILLDEVFVGVDTTNRGQVFGLLSALDLDLMLTSDHEWCTYAELGGVGIHQLITGGDGDDAVTTARFTWNGHDLLPAEPR